MSKPKLLDAFCGAGGCTRGYQMAGFDVTGVDINPQPRYVGERFVQADAIEYIREHGHEYDVIHASPPCQAYSVTKSLHKNVHPELLDPTRDALVRTGTHWVIENVVGAPLNTTIELCGAMFGLKVYRHRLFESSVMLFQPPHPPHLVPTLQRAYRTDWDGFVTVTGGGNVPHDQAEQAMGIDWMTRKELAQSIPPAYTEYIGTQLIAALSFDKQAA